LKLAPNRIKFYQFLNDDLSLEELVEWIYTNKELENIIPNDQYLDLISNNFYDSAVDVFLKSFIRRNFDWDEYEKWRTIKLLETITTGEFDMFNAAFQLSQLFLEQDEDMEEPLISIGLAVGYASELDRLPMESEYKNWNQEALEIKLEELERLKTSMLADIDNEIRRLKK
jgi:hypothetical protein